MDRAPALIKPVLATWRRLWRSRRGATAVEYGLIAALIVIATMASFSGVADITVTMWNNVSERVVHAR
ncbi:MULTISPECIES: Flp family type IVb pilin [unclassified Sphingomonas]|uniref:Flp family type IVb pilin n=1 Tax=unclassified Sphingomonas TaxID=196159 RepID=UPI001D11849B|nr:MULTISPECIES: Flp family type IVb pilin [unclassified Sphingomonas]MCC2980128.1 Flp family type IVb pilin [Sphingomonas sp. IC4-52]MCD2314879.1 Flp family type IVb pilin [Sphingomonas sp. IC-11]